MDPLVQAITIFHLDTCKGLTLLFVFTVPQQPLFTIVYPPWKIKIMVPGPIISWQTDRETMETVTEFIFLDSEITADGDCSHDVKRHLLLGRKSMTNLDSILKSRDITLPTKVRIVKATVFQVVMYGCESWTIYKAEHRITDALELGCWESLWLQGDQTCQS